MNKQDIGTSYQVETDEPDGNLETIRLRVPADLYRAFQRCTWVLINETGHSQLEIMEEVVEDFLIKHGC